MIYDLAGRVHATTDGLANRTTSVYDVGGRAVGSINALGFRSTTVFDAANETIAQIDPLGIARRRFSMPRDGQLPPWIHC